MSVQSKKDFTLPELIQHCCDRRSSAHARSWIQFMDNYRAYIYASVKRRAYEWNTPRLRRQMNDVVDDVVTSVIGILCENDFKALKNFRAKESEAAFRWYLQLICRNETGRYLKKYFPLTSEDSSVEDSVAVIRQFVQGMEEDTRAEFYEELVDCLRNYKASKGNYERDIHLFMLYRIADFDQDMIALSPCLQIGHRVVDNAANRIKTILVSALKERWS